MLLYRCKWTIFDYVEHLSPWGYSMDSANTPWVRFYDAGMTHTLSTLANSSETTLRDSFLI